MVVGIVVVVVVVASVVVVVVVVVVAGAVVVGTMSPDLSQVQTSTLHTNVTQSMWLLTSESHGMPSVIGV